MSYCVTPDCPHPENAPAALVCHGCGARLCLGERYRPLRPLSQGGFGRTFLAADEQLPSRPPCVIKQLAGRYANDPKARQLFAAEAQRLEDLGVHPQIPRLLARFEIAGTAYLVQEWIDGEPLDRALEDGPFSEADIRNLLRDLLPVLGFVHNRGIIHRDLKPSNLIRRHSDRAIVLIDFGIAKALQAEAIARTGTVIGSPEYVAPEQLRGKALPASDLYSLGVTCLALLTGLSPFELYDSRGDGWVWRDYLPPETTVSAGLGELLDRAIAPALSRRYASVLEMQGDLDRLAPLAAHSGQTRRALRPQDATHPPASPEAPTITSLRLTPYIKTQPAPPQRLPSRRAPWWTRWLPQRAIATPWCDGFSLAEQKGLAPPLQQDYRPLERWLAAGRWEQADGETQARLAALAGERRFVPVGEIARLPWPDLQAIDALWTSYSQGRFGFSVQARLLRANRDYGTFCDQVGWARSRSTSHADRLTFTLRAPMGHLPSRQWVGGMNWWGHAAAIAQRF